MDLNELNDIFINKGIVLRAIPRKVKGIYEKSHAHDFPDGKIQYLDEFRREMLVLEYVPEHAGEFLIEFAKNTDSIVRFSEKKYFVSLEDALTSILEMRSEQS